MTQQVNTLAELREKLIGESFKDSDEIYSFINQFKLHAKISVELLDNSKTNFGRVLITTNRFNVDFSSELTSAGGIVLDSKTWKVLAMPPPSFRIPKRKELIDKFESFELIEIKDGTSVTIYWYDTEEKWCLSTANGFDVGNYRWLSSLTYLEAIQQVGQKYNFSFDNLDKSKSYTIGFRHNSFHPLCADKEKLWFIQACDLDTLNTTGETVVSYDLDIGIPLQTKLTLQETGSKAIKIIEKKNTDAILRYKLTHKTSDPEICYGFIFRSKNEIYLLESTLLKSVRHMIYNLPKGNHNIDTPEKRITCFVLRAYLSQYKSQFIELFPQYSEHYKKYDNYISRLVARITTILRTRIGPHSSTKNKNADEIDQCIETMATKMSNHIKNNCQINANDPNGVRIITDFVTSADNFELHYSVLSRFC